MINADPEKNMLFKSSKFWKSGSRAILRFEKSKPGLACSGAPPGQGPKQNRNNSEFFSNLWFTSINLTKAFIPKLRHQICCLRKELSWPYGLAYIFFRNKTLCFAKIGKMKIKYVWSNELKFCDVSRNPKSQIKQKLSIRTRSFIPKENMRWAIWPE